MTDELHCGCKPEPIDADHPAEKQIHQFLHCKLCLAELPEGESPESYARVSIGMTKYGIQAWCLRHDCNMIHINFEGQKFPAETGRLPTKEEIFTLALNDAENMWLNSEIEIRSALKQAGSDRGIEYGEAMAEFVLWAETQLEL